MSGSRATLLDFGAAGTARLRGALVVWRYAFAPAAPWHLEVLSGTLDLGSRRVGQGRALVILADGRVRDRAVTRGRWWLGAWPAGELDRFPAAFGRDREATSRERPATMASVQRERRALILALERAHGESAGSVCARSVAALIELGGEDAARRGLRRLDANTAWQLRDLLRALVAEPGSLAPEARAALRDAGDFSALAPAGPGAGVSGQARRLAHIEAAARARERGVAGAATPAALIWRPEVRMRARRWRGARARLEARLCEEIPELSRSELGAALEVLVQVAGYRGFHHLLDWVRTGPGSLAAASLAAFEGVYGPSTTRPPASSEERRRVFLERMRWAAAGWRPRGEGLFPP